MLQGEDITQASAARLRELRATRMSMIFQEPMTALNPVMTCGDQIDEVLRQHTRLSADERRQKVLGIVREVLLPEPERMVASYPHQLSGGQRQRIMIAMALVLDPVLLIADEPTTALDVTTQAQILHLILQLQQRHGTGVLFITHDFGVVAEIAQRVAVLRLGELVELGSKAAVLQRPQHAYTQMLMASVPTLRVAGAPGRPHGAAGAAGARPEQDLRRSALVRQAAHRARGQGRRPRDPPRPDAGHRRRIGLGQEHGGALHRAPDRSERRLGAAPRRRHRTFVAPARCDRCAGACRSCSRIRTDR